MSTPERERQIAYLLGHYAAVDDDASAEDRYAHVMESHRIYDHRTVHTTDDLTPDDAYSPSDWQHLASFDLDSGQEVGNGS